MVTAGAPRSPGGGSERQAAITCFEQGDFAGAATRLVSLLARVPPDPLLLRLCGMALVRIGTASRGLGYLARATRLAPQDPVASLWHAIALQAAGRPEQAADAFAACATATPMSPSPLVHLARTLLQLNRPQAALSAARRALALAPELAEARHVEASAGLAVLQATGEPSPDRLADAWVAVARACLDMDKVAEAEAALQEALAASPLHAGATIGLALIGQLSGQPIAATDGLRALLRREPDCLPARLQLAAHLLLDHEADEALALLQTDLPTTHPELTRWHAIRLRALVMLGRHPEADAELARVRPPVGRLEIVLRWQHALLAHAAGDRATADALVDQVARLADLRDAAGLEDRIDAHFALGTVRDRQGRHEQAFRHWSQGHALLRLAQPFSRPAHMATLEAIMRAAAPDRHAATPRAGNADPAPVFIVGLPRTGTTLTEQILSAHRDVHGAGERLAIRETLVALTGTLDAAEAAERAALLPAATLDAAAGRYLGTLHALAPGARVILDKMPDNFRHLGFIASLLPGARVIVCTRELRDVGASIFQQRFLGHHPYAHDPADLGWYIAQHQRLLAHWRRSLAIPMLVLDHADWIADFDATLRRVLEFLDLGPDESCQRFFAQQRVVRTASRDQVRQPINARGVGRWQPYAAMLAPMLSALP